jgi:hypothetical protein
MADIFISYAREDLERVHPIVRLIESAGWSMFWDRTIPAGMTWRQYIGKALDEAKCIIVVWSKSSVESDWVIEEADDGRKRRILIPITIEDVIPPLGFRSIQHEDLSDWKGEPNHRRAKGLIKSVEGIAGKPEKPPSAPSEKPESKIPLQEFESNSEDSTSIKIEKPKSPDQKHKTGFLQKLWPKVVSLSVASLILLIGILIWIDTKGRKVEMKPSDVGEFVQPQGQVSDPAGNLHLSTLEINSRFIENDSAGKLFIITGQVKNGYTVARSHIQVNGKIYNQGKQLVKSENAFSGNILSDLDLKNLSFKEIQGRLNAKNGLQMANVDVKPGGTIPFMVVFSDLPENLEEFTIEVIGSAPATPPAAN